MFLQKLSEYAERLELPPAMYQSTPIRWLIDLDSEGNLLGFITLTGEGKGKRAERGKELLAPHIGRSSAVSPKLLADNGEYVLGVPRPDKKPERVAECHSQFVALVEACAEVTGEPAVKAVERFLAQWTPDRTAELPEDFDPGLVLTFRVGETIPISLPSVQSFWAGKTSEDSAGTARTMPCLVCGEVKPAEERLQVKVKGIPGGQTSGMALISANAGAFESHDLKASLIAPTCHECGERFANAINALIRDPSTHLIVGPLAYLFWTREKHQFSPVQFLAQPDPQEVKALIQTAWKGGPAPETDKTLFYASALSASGGRVAVRDWLETTVGNVRSNLASWFRRQKLVRPYGEEHEPRGIYNLAASLYRDAQRDMEAEVPVRLLRSALKGSPLPEGLLYKAVKRNCAEQGVTYPRMVLIKMILSAASRSHEEEEDAMECLDLSNKEPAYLCGRLLAELEQVQRVAINPRATIIDRYFGSASAAPASVFGNLLRGAQAHLGKLRKEKPGAHTAIQHRLEDILGGLPQFPQTLSLREQALFSLGYYHQRAADRAAAKSHKQNTGTTDAGQQ